MIVFIKAQFSSLIATAVDFLVTLLFVELLRANYMTAAINGAIAGAITNFAINRSWTFKRPGNESKKDGLKYIIVWLGSLTLNVMGSSLLISRLKMHYIPAKIIVAVIVGVTFNFALQKYYVFNNVGKTNKK